MNIGTLTRRGRGQSVRTQEYSPWGLVRQAKPALKGAIPKAKPGAANLRAVTQVNLIRPRYTKVSVVRSAVRMDLHRRIHSGHISRVYDRYAVRLPYEPLFRREPTASWPG